MKITLVTTMRNEGAHVLEWIAHHRAAGVTDFLVYTNDCEDGCEALLALLPDVTLVANDEGDGTPQWRALKAAWDHPVVSTADWVGCIDCDEFINISSKLGDIPQLIDAVGGDAILLGWRLFGHNGLADLSDASTTARFTRAAAEDMLYPAIGSYFKTLFRRDGPFRGFGVHRPKAKNTERHGLPVIADGSGKPLSGAVVENDKQIMHWGQPIARDLVQLNHYSLRSAAEFMVKRSRGLPNHQGKQIDLTYWVERNFNTVEDASILHMAVGTQVEMERLLAIDGVAAAQDACRAWQRDAFAALMREEVSLKLYGRLLLAGGSASLPKEAAMKLIDAYRGLDAKA
ncbi:glycosyltransferase family 2 protein [Litoreibacter sp.]|nr:glycosyltransferase family 2 protein [Litoreibacter sp.]